MTNMGYSAILASCTAAALSLSTLSAESGMLDWLLGASTAWEQGESSEPLDREKTKYIRSHDISSIIVHFDRGRVESEETSIYIQCKGNELSLYSTEIREDDVKNIDKVMYFVYVEPKYISGINESIKKSIDIYENKKISMSDQNKPDPELSDALGKFTHILQSADIIRYSFDRKTWSVVPSNGKLQAIDVVGAIRSLASKGDGGALLYYRGVERLYSKWGIAPAIDIDAAESIVSECRKRGFAG